MAVEVLELMNRVARAMESVVPGLSLRPQLGGLVWLEDEATESEVAAVSGDGGGEWVRALGFNIDYGRDWGAFEHATGGSEREQLLSVALQLMSDVQDIVAEATAEPWPLIVVNNRRVMTLPDAVIEGDELRMWYGERTGPRWSSLSFLLCNIAG
jgi:hypothetical protein